jgi:hypothetical protein
MIIRFRPADGPLRRDLDQPRVSPDPDSARQTLATLARPRQRTPAPPPCLAAVKSEFSFSLK